MQALEALEAVRVLVMDKIGQPSLLAQRPGKRMAKHKSKAVSAALLQRYQTQDIECEMCTIRMPCVDHIRPLQMVHTCEHIPS